MYKITIMTLKNPDARLTKEPKVAYAAFIEYRDERDLQKAYNSFMQNNPDALTSFKGFMKWATTYDWQKRVNAYDELQDMLQQRETRQMGRKNALTCETMAEELYECCMEEFKLKKSDMTHRDVAKYLEICQKIGDRWVKQPEPQTVVNVNQTVNTVDVPDDVIKALGRKMVEEDEEN